MKASCKITLEFKDKKTVSTILKSTQVDDLNFVKSKSKDNALMAEINADSISSLLHTLDDYLACVSVASKVVDKD